MVGVEYLCALCGWSIHVVRDSKEKILQRTKDKEKENEKELGHVEKQETEKEKKHEQCMI